MCNLYRLRENANQIAPAFGVTVDGIAAGNTPEEVYPGYPGMVVREVGGRRVMQTMTWGFPRVMKSARTGLSLKPKPVNNARNDKLLTSFWRSAFERRRAIIPLTAWAEAEGETGRMTRTWYSLPGVDVFAVAAIWRPSDEWGNVYSMVMVDGSKQMADVHDRMPVILRPDEYEQWMQGTPDEAMHLVRTWDDELTVDRSATPWASRRAAEAAGTLL